jgi:hypothetical protein
MRKGILPAVFVLVAAIAPALARDRGFVTVDPGGRYFRFEDGTPFVPVGLNDWPETLDVRVRSRRALERYFRNLRRNRVNVLRVILEAAPPDENVFVEDPPGTLTPEFTEWMDTVVGLAERHGVYLVVALYPNLFDGALGNFQYHPYAVGNPDGVLEASHDLVWTPEGRELAKGRIRLLVDRWGESSHVFSWELANEFWLPDAGRTGLENAAAHNAWIDEVGRYAAEYEDGRLGHHHLRSVSTLRSEFPRPSKGFGPDDTNIYTSGELDFASFHAYGRTLIEATGSENDLGVLAGNRIEPARLIRAVRDTMTMMLERAPGRPVLCTEDFQFANPSAPSWQNPFNPVRKMLEDYTDRERFDLWIAANWSFVMSGAAGTTMRYPMGFYERRLLRRERIITRFLRKVDWRDFAPTPAHDLVTTDREDLIVLAMSDGHRAIAWLYQDVPFADRRPIRPEVTLTGLADGPYELLWFDGRTGRRLRRQHAAGETITVTAPAFRGHAALYLR